MNVRSLSRSLINRLLLRPLPIPFRHESGDCWSASLPGLVRYADDQTHLVRSTLALYEDGKSLQRSHSPLDDIKDLGGGRYAHWEDRLYFASSDASDPNCNGRAYHYSLSSWLYRRRIAPPELDPSRPVNHRKRDIHPARIQADVDYALRVGRAYLDTIRSLGESLAGKRVLEIGPGINYGCAMLFAAHGARPVVLDRFLAPWEHAYHHPFYSLERQELQRSDRDIDVHPLTRVLDQAGYSDDVIGCLSAPLETAPLAANHFDFVISNAVVEHLADLDRAFAQLYRVTRPGGYGLHQVDFRDHRNFEKPLEYLLLKDDVFLALFERCHSECGNRYRPDEVAERLRAAGFEVIRFVRDMFTEPDYLARFVPRLRQSSSRYREWPEEGLQAISGLFIVRKPKE
jgi:SAM-dependent methyltransferase